MKLSSLWDISFFRCPFFSIWFKAVAFFSFPQTPVQIWVVVVSVMKDHLHPRPREQFLQVNPWSPPVSPILSPHIRHLQCHAHFQSQFGSNRDGKILIPKNDKNLIHKKNALSTFLWPLLSTKFGSKYFFLFFHLNHPETVGRHIDHVEFVVSSVSAHQMSGRDKDEAFSDITIVSSS